MFSIIQSLCWGILSAGILILAALYTNKRAVRTVSGDGWESVQSFKSYRMNRYSGSILLLITAVSAACGYLVSVYAVSIAACIELGVCYLAVLGSAVIDFKLRIIPNYIPLSLLAARLLLFVYELLCVDEALSAMLSSLLGCFLCGVVLVIADKISKGGIGKGDIKLICSIGFVCGIYAVLTSLLLSMLSCILVAVILLLAKKKTAKDLLPFGPFIYLGFTGMLLLTLY